MLSRLLTDFHEDCTPICITSFRLLCERFPEQMAQWIPAAVAQVPAKDLRQADREKFLATFGTAIQAGNLAGIRNAFTALDRAARKDRERMMASNTRR
jgi:transportin-3